jgi:hypothetical protein
MTKAEIMAKKSKDAELDFEKDISINKFRLDEECLSHAGIYARYLSAQADADTAVSRAKDNLELVKSERYDAIKAGFEKKGIKFTIPMMDKAVAGDEEVIAAKNELREAENVFAKLTVAVKAFEHRRSELDNLVKLYCAGYYSMPSSNDGGSRVDANEQVSKEMRKKLNNKGSEND